MEKANLFNMLDIKFKHEEIQIKEEQADLTPINQYEKSEINEEDIFKVEPACHPRDEDLENGFFTSASSEVETFATSDVKPNLVSLATDQATIISGKEDKTHICNICNKSFKLRCSLQVHLRIHAQETPYICPYCEKPFSDGSNYRRHLRLHTNEKPYTCNICEKSFTLMSTLKLHISTHTLEKPFVCTVCNKAFSQRGNLKNHLKIHTKNRELHLCPFCEKTYSDKANLRRHMKSRHYNNDLCNEVGRSGVGESPTVEGVFVAIQPEYIPVKIEETCVEINPIALEANDGVQVKDEVFNSIDDLNTVANNKSLPPANVIIKNEPSVFTCNICNKGFNLKRSLTTHLKTHSGEKEHFCTICKKSFTQKGSLNAHLRIHMQETPYSCEFCQKTFTDGSNYKRHLRTHTKEKPYSCVLCNRSFSLNSTLKSHLHSHTQEKPYNCTVCGKKFAQSGYFAAHMKTHK